MKTYHGPYKIVTEPLGTSHGNLKSFYFKRGANFYVFSYDSDGVRRHTLIDTGDRLYRDRILTILRDNGIERADIERIIITHHHRDHCGLIDIVGDKSQAQVVVHGDFRGFIEACVRKEHRHFVGSFQPARFQGRDMMYLAPSPEGSSFPIGGMHFPRLADSIRLGTAGRLDILACPVSTPTHSPVQLVVLYSPRLHPYSLEKPGDGFRLTDDIIFAGDLWLMQGPLHAQGLQHLYRYLRFAYYDLKNVLSGNPPRSRDFREQDAEAKMALKQGFSLIRVKPGHGQEFLGSRIIPQGLLADRDILLLLGLSMADDKSILKSGAVAPRVSEILETAYRNFVAELSVWREQGYDENEISDLLCRIYREQSGGGRLVEEDRRERRERLVQTLRRLRDETKGREGLGRIAVTTLQKLSFVSQTVRL